MKCGLKAYIFSAQSSGLSKTPQGTQVLLYYIHLFTLLLLRVVAHIADEAMHFCVERLTVVTIVNTCYKYKSVMKVKALI